jgi:hypothetical protein
MTWVIFESFRLLDKQEIKILVPILKIRGKGLEE